MMRQYSLCVIVAVMISFSFLGVDHKDTYACYIIVYSMMVKGNFVLSLHSA